MTVSSVSGPRAAAPSSSGDDAAATRLLNLARSHLGWHEGANNTNPYTAHVMGDPNQPWCTAFVSTMLEQAKIPGISGKIFSAGCIELKSQFQSMGRFMPRGSGTPQPGDVILFGNP